MWGADFSMKGVNPVEALSVLMMLKCTLGNAFAQPVWFHLTWNQRACTTVLIECSDDLSVCGWYAVDILCLIPDSFISTFQNFKTNSLSWSVISSRGQPFLQNHLLKKTVANSSVVMLVLQAANWTLAPSWSVMVTITLYPSSLGSGPMKSIVTDSKCLSGMGSGWRGPAGLEVQHLLCWHSLQDRT